MIRRIIRFVFGKKQWRLYAIQEQVSPWVIDEPSKARLRAKADHLKAMGWKVCIQSRRG